MFATKISYNMVIGLFKTFDSYNEALSLTKSVPLYDMNSV